MIAPWSGTCSCAALRGAPGSIGVVRRRSPVEQLARRATSPADAPPATSNDGGIVLRPCSSNEELGEVAGLGPLLGPDADELDLAGDRLAAVAGTVIRPKVSIVGAIASTSVAGDLPGSAPSPRRGCRSRRGRCDSTTTSARTPCSRSRIFSEKPAMTELTTIIVATPSITLMMLASAM